MAFQKILVLLLPCVLLTACAAGLPGIIDLSNSSSSVPDASAGPGFAAVSINELHWSYAGPIPGKYCVQWLEAADTHTWSDNYLCSDRDLGFVWKSDASIDASTQYCLQINEPGDPDTWSDNYLCSPWDMGLSWSYTGKISGQNCLMIDEPAEPIEHGWTDNFLCLR